ncbi:hypothetical protein TELCIR_14405 [Teladorsagia circumcincta]|uniref:Uncharacterized protein n=1 Tax=Teladorsagia circumcincta TaxID=45464 RepID=A0A2G9U2Q0_TELCI|nr:hypothetical protein TELCIR_14405 [Teladorsagia circumcincta]
MAIANQCSRSLDEKPIIKKEVKCEDVEPEDVPVTEKKQEDSVLTTQIKSDVEDRKPEVAPEALPAALAQTTSIPLATTVEGNKDMLGGMQGYPPTANTTFGTLGLIPQTIPPLVAAPTLFPYDNGGLLPHAISRMVPNQPFFSCERPPFTGNCFTAVDILNTASTPIFLRQFQPVFQTRRRVQVFSSHHHVMSSDNRFTFRGSELS